MMTNPSLDTTTSAGPRSSPSGAGNGDLQRLSERFEQALRDVEGRGDGNGEAATGQAQAEAPAEAAYDDERGEHDARDDESTHELAGVAAASVTAAPLQAASTAQAAVGGAADPCLAASATQGAIGAGLGLDTPAASPVSAAPGESPSAWSLTLPGLQAWSMQATQPNAGGAWTIDLVAPPGHDTMHGAAAAAAVAAVAGSGARIDAAALAAQAQVLSQRLSARDIAVDRVTLRRRGAASDDEDVVADPGVPGAIDAARGRRQRP